MLSERLHQAVTVSLRSAFISQLRGFML